MLAKKKLRKAYDKLFKQDPIEANLFLLMCESANKNGNVMLNNGPDGTPADEISELMQARFNDPEEYAL